MSWIDEINWNFEDGVYDEEDEIEDEIEDDDEDWI